MTRTLPPRTKGEARALAANVAVHLRLALWLLPMAVPIYWLLCNSGSWRFWGPGQWIALLLLITLAGTFALAVLLVGREWLRLRRLAHTLPDTHVPLAPREGTCARCGDLLAPEASATLPDACDYCPTCLRSFGGEEFAGWVETRLQLPSEKRWIVPNRPPLVAYLFSRGQALYTMVSILGFGALALAGQPGTGALIVLCTTALLPALKLLTWFSWRNSRLAIVDGALQQLHGDRRTSEEIACARTEDAKQLARVLDFMIHAHHGSSEPETHPPETP